MLYMVMDSRGKDTLIKVGYTHNLKRRMASYQTHNPLVKLVATLDYDTDLLTEEFEEQACHLELAEMGYRRISGTEWFVIPKGEKKKWRKDGFENLPLYQRRMNDPSTGTISHSIYRKNNTCGEINRQ